MGVTGCSVANEIAQDADLIVGVGTRYTDFTTSSKWLFREDAEFVNINVSEFQAAKLDVIPVVADARDALEKLYDALDGYRASYTGEIYNALSDWNKEYDRLASIEFEFGKGGGDEGYIPEINDANAGSALEFANNVGSFLTQTTVFVGSFLTQTTVLAAFNRMIDAERGVIGASGSLPGGMQRMWRVGSLDTYNMEYGCSCVGYEVSGALGVKFAVGDNHEVYAMVGDGAFVMLHSELLTAVQEHVKINVVVFDNSSFGCINNLQVAQGNSSFCTELRFRNPNTGKHDGKFISVDFAGIARAYGARAFTIRSIAELEKAFAEAKKITGVPVVFDIKVMPKSMTDGYGSWWRVGSAEVGGTEANRAAWTNHLEHERSARKY